MFDFLILAISDKLMPDKENDTASDHTLRIIVVLILMFITLFVFGV